MTLPDPTVEPTIDVERAGEIVGLGRRAAYVQAARYLETGGTEGLPVLKFGRALRVPTAALLRMLSLEAPS
jgi:hypothetical protein